MCIRDRYNRAGVERVMNFCTHEEYLKFMRQCPKFEEMIVDEGIIFFKYWLDITKEEQKRRLEARKKDPLKQWKISPIDMQAQKYWDAYSKARNKMFEKTSFVFAPWQVVHSDEKKEARINCIKHFLSQMDYPDKKEDLLVYKPEVVCKFSENCYKQGLIFP